MAIIQARLTSTRLPKKVLQKIGDKTILQRCIDNVIMAQSVDEVVVASPHDIRGYQCDVYADINESDVLGRYYRCADSHSADIVVRVTADCPFIDPKVIDYAVEYFKTHDYAYCCVAPIDGLDVEVFPFWLLEEAHKNTQDVYDREHVTPYMRRKTKLSVDNPLDLKRARAWYGLH